MQHGMNVSEGKVPGRVQLDAMLMSTAEDRQNAIVTQVSKRRYLLGMKLPPLVCLQVQCGQPR